MNPPSARRSIAILIPAHNEAAMISACVDSCLAQSRPADEIVVVNDGSTDVTGELLKAYGERIRVITLPYATGNKSKAQAIGIASLQSDYFIATDGDTILASDFVEQIEHSLIADPSLSAVAGYVKSTHYNALTALREIDYTIGQDIYKQAQSYIDFVLIIPGCAGAFKTELFKDGTVTFDHDTLTEDLDFTYKLHAAGKRIGFNPNAVVYTQDPHTIHSYINQMRRWYAGGWQNLRKHGYLTLKRPSAALQLTLNYVEGIVFSTLFLLMPLANPTFTLQLFFIYLIVRMLAGLYAAIRRGRPELFVYSPLGVPLGLLNAWLFIEQFLKEIVFRMPTTVWFHPERRVDKIRSV